MSEAVILLNGVSVMAGSLQRTYEHNEGVVPTISMPNIREALGEVRDMCGYSICIRNGQRLNILHKELHDDSANLTHDQRASNPQIAPFTQALLHIRVGFDRKVQSDG